MKDLMVQSEIMILLIAVMYEVVEKFMFLLLIKLNDGLIYRLFILITLSRLWAAVRYFTIPMYRNQTWKLLNEVMTLTA